MKVMCVLSPVIYTGFLLVNLSDAESSKGIDDDRDEDSVNDFLEESYPSPIVDAVL